MTLPCHRKVRAENRAARRVYETVNPAWPIAQKVAAFQKLRALRTRLDFVSIDLALTWLIENGLPGSRERCVDPLQYLAAGNAQRILELVRAELRQAERFSKPPATTPDPGELEAAEKSEADLLARIAQEYPDPRDRAAAIARELEKIRPIYGDENDALIKLAIARIAQRLQDAAEFEKRLAG